MKSPSVKAVLKIIGQEAQRQGLRVWAVGGCVRDFYLKKETKDIDISVEADPAGLVDFCIKKWGGSKESFDVFGTYRVHLKNNIKLDFVRCRSEVYPTPAALPVVTPATIKEDLFRRDFTSNAWAMSILPTEFEQGYDPYGAQKDIDKKQIKILHDKSFKDDPTRIYRALRFAGRFNWKLEAKTEKLLKAALKNNYPQLLSKERLRQELIKILQEKEVKRIFTLMQKYGAQNFIYPGLKYNNAVAKTNNLTERIGILACVLKQEGFYLLEDLRLARAVTQELLTVLEVYNNKISPLKELTKEQKNIITLISPKLPGVALKTPLLGGADIIKLGAGGKQISDTQKYLRKLQYKGKIKNKKEALTEAKKCLKIK